MFYENLAVYVGKMVEPDRPQVAVYCGAEKWDLCAG
jgi:hypothetical protein